MTTDDVTDVTDRLSAQTNNSSVTSVMPEAIRCHIRCKSLILFFNVISSSYSKFAQHSRKTMTRQDSPIRKSRSVPLALVYLFSSHLALGTGMVALFVVAGGSMLSPIEANASATKQSPELTQDSGLRTQDSGLRTQHSALRTQDSGLRTQHSGLSTQHSGLRTQDSALRTQHSALLHAQIPASATVVYVNPATGSDTASAGTSEATPYKTITYALNQAQANTVIQLAPGSYTKDTGEAFPLVIKPGVILRGDEANKGETTTIIGSGQFISPSFARQNITIRAENNTTISGITITNPDLRGSAIWVESTNPTITKNTFANSNREGVFVTGSGNPKIENNVFVGNKGNGVSLTRAAQGEIRNNVFQNTGFGLAIGGNSTPLVTDNQIIQNNDGVFISDSAKPVLRNNVIQNNTRDGVVAITSAQPDLGTKENPGGNLIRNNKRHDVNNATRGIKIFAIGNDIDQKRIVGDVEFVAAEVEPPPDNGVPTTFKDVPAGFWAKAYIEALASRKIIAGFPEGTYKPNDPVTRAQFAAIIAKAFTPAPKREAIQFTDVSRNFWGFEAIQTASRGGFIAGYPDRTFQPEQQIPRVQVLVALANGLGLTADKPNVLSAYADAAQIPNYATNSIAAATVRQLVVNYPNVKQLNPNRQANRAEVAAFVYQALVNAGRAEAIASPYLVTVP